jgi:hypothetical protein
MSNIDWNKVKFRASSWGNLLTESKDGKGLGLVCQKELIKIYNQLKYGRKKDITTKQMDKGTQVQTESIKMYSLVEGKIFKENDEQLENDFFTGKPDVFLGKSITEAEQVDDIKNSWELDTFTPKLIESMDKGYEAQLNVYLDLSKAKGGNIVYTLMSAPFNIIESEKRKLLYSMNVISEESPEYLRAADELERLMVFDDIDIRERVIKHPVQRNDALIEKMKLKVPIFREWLSAFDKKHMALYPKL